MEDNLDAISRGENSKNKYLNSFYFGNEDLSGLKEKLEQEFDKNSARLISVIEDNNKKIEIKIGRYGIYGEIENERFTIPNDLPPSNLTLEKIKELLENPSSIILGI